LYILIDPPHRCMSTFPPPRPTFPSPPPPPSSPDTPSPLQGLLHLPSHLRAAVRWDGGEGGDGSSPCLPPAVRGGVGSPPSSHPPSGSRPKGGARAKGPPNLTHLGPPRRPLPPPLEVRFVDGRLEARRGSCRAPTGHPLRAGRKVPGRSLRCLFTDGV
jgi:hypothetical protein